jgi:GT2 family glycosyltransferase
MDDDVTVDPMWLQRLTAALPKGKWAGCGGRILPEWSCMPPQWLPDRGHHALSPLAVFDLGLEAGRLAEAPFGTNMAFQKAVFAKYGGFRTDLGPRPGSEIRSEDSEFGSRLLAAGEQLWYEPSAIVHHAVQQNRLRKQYFLTWWFDKARADIRAFGLPADIELVLAGIPLRLFRRLAVWTARWMLAVGPSRRFSNKLKVWSVAGQILECYRQARSAQREAQ